MLVCGNPDGLERKQAVKLPFLHCFPPQSWNTCWVFHEGTQHLHLASSLSPPYAVDAALVVSGCKPWTQCMWCPAHPNACNDVECTRLRPVSNNTDSVVASSLQILHIPHPLPRPAASTHLLAGCRPWAQCVRRPAHPLCLQQRGVHPPSSSQRGGFNKGWHVWCLQGGALLLRAVSEGA
jgi:hypothetical protein